MSDEENYDVEIDYGDEDYDESLGVEVDLDGEDLGNEFSDEYGESIQCDNDRKVSFVACEGTEVEQIVNKSISEMSALLNVSSGDAAILLRKYSWDKSKLIDEFTDDATTVAKKTGIVLELPPAPLTSPKNKVECLICLEDVPLNQSFGLACGHMYCNQCWKEYLGDKLSSTDCLSTKCPSPNCNIACPDTVFCLLLSPQQFNKYRKINIDSYVDLSTNRKWCPNPGCKNYIESLASSIQAFPVECKCGFQFCFLCHDYEIGDHAPADCTSVEKWLKKAADESENVQWITANTKKCPKCLSHIEKNGGCMHMTCRKCHHEFCWLCRKDWSGHSNCNITTEIQKEEANAKKAANELEHYMFYFHRYEAHREAMKIADKQHTDAAEKGVQFMNQLHVRSQDIKFLKEATRQLLRNRKMLQYSYVYGYYLSKERVRAAEKDLFLYLQKELEHHTDRLSEMYEKTIKDIDYDVFVKWKVDITNYTRVSQKFLQNFIEGVIFKTLTHPEGFQMSDEERFYIVQLEALESMGFANREFTLPLLVKYDGLVERVVEVLLSQ